MSCYCIADYLLSFQTSDLVRSRCNPEIILIQAKISFLKSIDHFFRQEVTIHGNTGVELLTLELFETAPPISIPSSLTW